MVKLSPLVLVAVLVSGTSAYAQARFLFGVRAGVAAPNELQFGPGPMAGADVTWSMARLVALELLYEHGRHTVGADGGGLRGRTSLVNLGLQYRIDITPNYVPYVSLAVESRWLVLSNATNMTAGGAFAVGILSPFGENWFGGLEARYGITGDGGFPLRQSYLVRFGYRTHPF